jgi:hypothetical protein
MTVSTFTQLVRKVFLVQSQLENVMIEKAQATVAAIPGFEPQLYFLPAKSL